jgi:hypothetical protein
MRRTLSTRLEKLEANCRQNDALAADRCGLIRQDALRQLSADELRDLLAARRAVESGRTLTDRELAAVKALNSATEVACQRAGMALPEFKTTSPPIHTALRSRAGGTASWPPSAAEYKEQRS